MKKLMIVLGLLVGTSLSQSSFAQVNISINIGNQPVWGPTGYDYVEYYYLPDLDLYYYVPLQQWVYYDRGRWITANVLPARYQNYDLYRMHKVVMNEKQPYLRNQTYRTKYASFKGRYDQQPIRDSRDSKYFVNKDHPQYNGNQGNSRGNDRIGGNKTAPQDQNRGPKNQGNVSRGGDKKSQSPNANTRNQRETAPDHERRRN